MTKVRLALVDESRICREGLVELLERESSIEVICACCTGLEALESAHNCQPDVILINTELSECSTIEAIQLIHQELPKTSIVVLTSSKADVNFLSCVKAGARAYISKDISGRNLVNTILVVAEAEADVIVSTPMAARLLLGPNFSEEHKDAAKLGDLTLLLSEREQAVLFLVAQGSTNKEIAGSLFISGHTVTVHLRNIMQKLHVHNRRRAVALARVKTTV